MLYKFPYISECMAWHMSPSTLRMNPTPPFQDFTDGCCTASHFEVCLRPGRDGFKVHFGTVLGDKFAAMLEIRPPKTVPQYTLKQWQGLTFIREDIIFHDD